MALQNLQPVCAVTDAGNHAKRASQRSEEQTSRDATTYKTSGQATNTRTYGSHTGTPTTCGDTDNHYITSICTI